MNRLYDNKGFTLIEMLMVLLMIGIILLITIPNVLNSNANSDIVVGNANVAKLENAYETHLAFENMGHSKNIFAQYLRKFGKKICHLDGVISYVDGKVKCSEHPIENEEKENVDEVPYL